MPKEGFTIVAQQAKTFGKTRRDDLMLLCALSRTPALSVSLALPRGRALFSVRRLLLKIVAVLW